MEITNKYKTIKQIGKGSFGTVELVENQVDAKKYVIKKLDICSENRQCILKQVNIMKKLRHQYITRYYEDFLDNNDQMCIVMQYAQSGDLQRYLNHRKNLGQPLTQTQVLEWFIQLCLGLKYIHNHRVLHRDLKCQNIFIDSQNQLKIGDFGISKLMHQTFDMAQTKIGTPYAMAPQIWENKMYNQKSDLWSLGCILYKMMTFNHAFQAQNVGSYIIKITKGQYPPITGNYSHQLKALVTEMLSLQPQNRPSVHSILERNFIKPLLTSVLNNSIEKYQENLIENKNNWGLQRKISNNRLSSQRKSFSSLSNSSILTPKNLNTLDNTKMVEMKQSYPILLEQSKLLKQQLSKNHREKDQFVQGCKLILEKMKKSANNSGKIQQQIQLLEYKLSSYLYP